MPKKRPTDENSMLYHNVNHGPGHFLNEPVLLHIMREMDVKPLNTTPFTDEFIFESDAYSEKRPLQTVNGTKRRRLVIPETSPSFKAYRDEFVLFQKSPPFQSQEDFFSMISDEIILYIFQWLPKSSLIKCAEVCKRWKNISYDESLWTKYDLGKRFIAPGVLETLVDRGVSMLRLATSEIKSPIFRSIEFTSRQKFSKLRYLDLSMTSVSAESLSHLLGVCNVLKKLSLEACVLNEDCCTYIAQNRELEVLNMSMCTGLTLGGLRKIASNCVRMKEWNLAWTHLSVSCFESFLPLLPRCLKRFNISGHSITFEDKALIVLVQSCPNLIELDISDCHNVSGVSFMVLIDVCKKMEHLHISRCFKIETDCYRYLRRLKNLKYLEVFRTLKDEVLAAVRRTLPHVKLNSHAFSTIARPTTGIKRTSIWGLRVRE